MPTIGWYPGHMNKARKDITKALKSIDLVIELVDARLPYSSENPLLHSLIGDKPCLKILNKADLADDRITESWLAYYRSRGIEAITLEKSQEKIIRKLPAQARTISGIPSEKVLRLMILGIPNVGKSTLINLLLQRKVAAVGNEPAVTKAPQEIALSESIKLLDTPGVLWPKIEDQNAAYRLAVTGAIKNTAIEFEDIALFAVDFLRAHYPERVSQRYQLENLQLENPAILEAIGRKRGCLRKGGVDLHKASEVLLNDLRSGALGKISLEQPADIPPADPAADPASDIVLTARGIPLE